MSITDYIDSEIFIIIPVLYIIGIMIKKSSINDKWIPLILGGVGIILATAYKLTAQIPGNGTEVMGAIYWGVTQGILCAAGSVYANNIFKQLKGKKEDESDNEGDSEGDSDLR